MGTRANQLATCAPNPRRSSCRSRSNPGEAAQDQPPIFLSGGGDGVAEAVSPLWSQLPPNPLRVLHPEDGPDFPDSFPPLHRALRMPRKPA